MDRPDYLSLLPRDITNIVNQNILLNLDYNEFIEYCGKNSCNDAVWKRKGIMDFPDFQKTLGVTSKAKNLRKAAREEFNKLRKMVNSKSKEKEPIQVREGEYRHGAKLLDFKGEFDNFRSYNYILPKKLIEKLDKPNSRQIFASFVPENFDGNWIVVIRSDENILYLMINSGESFSVYNLQYYHNFTDRLRDRLGVSDAKNYSPNDILRVFDFITSYP